MSDTFAFTDLSQTPDLFLGETRSITEIKNGYCVRDSTALIVRLVTTKLIYTSLPVSIDASPPQARQEGSAHRPAYQGETTVT